MSLNRNEKLKLGEELFMRYVVNSVDSEEVVVIVHGLTSYIHESLYEDARRFFNSKNLDVCRPELYSWQKGGRRLRDCTLEIHGKDLDQLIAKLQKTYKKIYLIGHSYGCPSILSMTKSYDKACMWDGTYVGMPKRFLATMEWLSEYELYADFSGAGFMLGKAMVDEAEDLRANTNWLSAHKVPTHFVYAGAGILHKYRLKQLSAFEKKGIICSSEVIEAADHNFTDDKVKDKLFETTYNYFVI